MRDVRGASVVAEVSDSVSDDTLYEHVLLMNKSPREGTCRIYTGASPHRQLDLGIRSQNSRFSFFGMHSQASH